MNAEAKTLAAKLRDAASRPGRGNPDYICVITVADALAAIEFLDRLSAPVEGVGLTGDLPRIWLSNADNADPREGRFWAPDADVFSDDEGDPVEYVRADLATAALAAKEAERALVEAERDRAQQACEQIGERLTTTEAERDALKAALAIATAQVTILREAHEKCNGALRSASAVAERYGAKTNWSGLMETLRESLDLSHMVLNALDDGGHGDIPPESEHDWHKRPSLPFVSCRRCGIVQRADGKNSPCKGHVYVELRDTPTPPAATSDGGEAVHAQVNRLIPMFGFDAEGRPRETLIAARDALKRLETAERQRDEATALVERVRGRVEELDAVQTSAWLLCCEARADLGDRRLIKAVADKFDRAIRILAGEEKAPRALLSEPQASEGRDG